MKGFRHAASSKALDGTNADDVTQAGGAEQGSVTHATEERSVRSLAPSFGYLMVALPIPMAMTLHTIITRLWETR